MRITAIEPQKNDPSRRTIAVDGEFFLGISADVLVKFGLRKGDEVSREQLDAIAEAEELVQAKRKALDYLSRRMHSEKELSQKLSRKGYSDDTIRQVAEDFRGAGYLNDTQFAVAYVSDMMQKRPVGRRSLGQRLRAKGIGKEIIETVLSTALESDREETAALEAARKKLRTARSQFDRLDRAKKRQRLGQFLAQRGFDWDIIRRVVDALVNEE